MEPDPANTGVGKVDEAPFFCSSSPFFYSGYEKPVNRVHDIPFVAIGGIKISNLREVLKHGTKTVCLVTGIIGSDNIGKRIREIRKIFKEFKGSKQKRHPYPLNLSYPFVKNYK